jgi:surface antigen
MRGYRAAIAAWVMVGAVAAPGEVLAREKPADQHQQAALPQTSFQPRGIPPPASGGISCVPYARAVTGMQITGNGVNWWGNAAGIYHRGQQPEPGAVMAFRASGNMSRGHVAVVRRVLGRREVQIDHANWGGPGIRRGSVMRNVRVIDVSDRNDWTAVRVQSGHDSDAFGRTYPIFGFIYNRPDEQAPKDWANDGTAYASRPGIRYEQVAEMPDAGADRSPRR